MPPTRPGRSRTALPARSVPSSVRRCSATSQRSRWATTWRITKTRVPRGVSSLTQLRSLLVPATNDPAANTITIGTATISGLGGSAPLADTTGAGRLSLSGFTNPVLIPMRQTVVATTASPDSLSSTRGIGLKVLSFEVSADHSTVIWGPKDSIRFVGTNAGEAFFEDSIPVQPIEPPLNGIFQVRFQDKLERIVVNGGSSSVETIEGVVAVFTLEKLTGKDSDFARIIDLRAVDAAGRPIVDPSGQPVSLGATNPTEWHFAAPGLSLSQVGRTPGLRFTSVNVGRPGSAHSITVAPLPFGEAPSGNPVLEFVALPPFRQATSGYVPKYGRG